ncbi:uncharacterized protein K02A2.6-like [Photinus pyralis]|nr:uncharacterized protein K02A2.6-like [Photinus pyralis]
MALIGTIEPFAPGTSDIEAYIERMDLLFICNIVEEDKKVPLFLTLIGTETYSILKDLVSPDNPKSKSYSQLKEALTTHFSAKKIVIAERFRFYRCSQGVNDEALRDRFVCGLLKENIQTKLLSESDLTFEKACSTALSMETASEQTKSLQPADVNKIMKKQQFKTSKVYPTHESQGDRENFKFSKKENYKPCFRCNRKHNPSTCPAANWDCFLCHRKGHTSTVCRAKKSRWVSQVEEMESEHQGGVDVLELNQVTAVGEENGDLQGVHSLTAEMNTVRSLAISHVSNKKSVPVLCKVYVNNNPIVMEIDTGAAVSICCQQYFSCNFSSERIRGTDIKMQDVSGNEIKSVGQMNVRVSLSATGPSHMLSLIVSKTKNSSFPLMGRNWLDVILPSWRSAFSPYSRNFDTSICSITGNDIVSDLKKQFPKVFSENKVNGITGIKARLVLKDDASMVYHKAYTVPYKMKELIESKLKTMIKDGILIPVTHADIASPIVCVPKQNGGIRICVDFKKTLNPVLRTDYYPLPTLDEICHNIKDGKVFTILDLSEAYLQLPVEEQSQELLTINTHMGLMRFTRLPYGVSSAPAIFQSTMERVLEGLKVGIYIDDVIISGRNFTECYTKVKEVLSRFEKHNIRINKDKSIFFKPEVEFLGYKLVEGGLQPLQSKVTEIKNAPVPRDVTQLRSYVGLLNFYSKFIPMLSTILHPLYGLLRKDVVFCWNDECQTAFDKSKELLGHCFTLTHYNPDNEIIITTDASAYGLGAVLSQKVNNEVKPVMCASCTLSAAEKNYSQVEKEALGIVFAIKKFHKFIFGHKFTLITDHEPLKTIFGNKKSIPTLSHSRLQRWAIILSGYEYNIIYKKGSEVANADGFSRLPLKLNSGVQEVLSFTNMEEQPVTAEVVRSETGKDLNLIKVRQYVKEGWPQQCPNETLKPYFSRRMEITIDNDCLSWGCRVIIPKTLREHVLELLHDQHPGIVRMKLRARSDIWWPGITQDIEEKIRNCEECQIYANNRQEGKMLQWPLATNNWQRVHADFFKFEGIEFLIIIDSKTRWLEVFMMPQGTNAAKTISKFRTVFSCFGLPEILITDNGPPFNSKEFEIFCRSNGIQLKHSPPYHPPSNGAVEKQVHTTKRNLQKQLFQSSKCTETITL